MTTLIAYLYKFKHISWINIERIELLTGSLFMKYWVSLKVQFFQILKFHEMKLLKQICGV